MATRLLRETGIVPSFDYRDSVSNLYAVQSALLFEILLVHTREIAHEKLCIITALTGPNFNQHGILLQKS